MKPLAPFVIYARCAIFIFVVLMVMGKVEHKVSLAVSSNLSADYAKWISDLHKSADILKRKDPEGFDYTTRRMGFASVVVCATTLAILSGLIVWWRKDSRGMPNEQGGVDQSASGDRESAS